MPRKKSAPPPKRKANSTSAAPPAAEPTAKAAPRGRKLHQFPIVGIGASAGGLEAYEHFFTHMPPDTGMAFVLVQHLDPTHKSILADLLQRYTPMPVYQVEDGMRVSPNSVYIIPPNRDMAVLHGTLHLVEPVAPRGQRAPIDTFFHSLARDQQERAICIVLSGTGSDGTLGLKSVKGEGGMAMVQEPASAKYDGMPRSALATGLADYVVPPDKMATQLIAYVNHSVVPAKKGERAELPKTAAALEKIFVLLRDQTGHDFTFYKKNTIVRRVQRRMAVTQMEVIDHYVRYLQKNPLEVETLFKELLIAVTSFFRDPEAFAALGEHVIRPLLERADANQPLRVWVPGCSTGEEAYSIAMLFRERLDGLGRTVPVQLFATDIDPDAIETARAAVYPQGIVADVSPERLQRFFDKSDTTYRVKREIRDMLVFAPQNVCKDPPFSKLDLISCRNLLIYMDAELQARVLPLFHYALNEDGCLFLGTSESIGHHANLSFAVIDRKWKIFQRTGETMRHPLGVGVPAFPTWPDYAAARPAQDATKPARLHDLAERVLLERYCPACAIINEECDVRYIHGHTGRYLEPAAGEPNTNILAMAREGLRLELTTAVRRCLQTKQPVRRDRVRIKNNGGTEMVDLVVAPLPAPPARQGLMMVVFEDRGADEPVESDGVSVADLPEESQRRINELEHELASTREYLQTTIEELETSNEELKSTNEELQSSNEELQSTNEELSTSKEELQSVNEELMTVNAELETKLAELAKVNNDLANLFGATRIGTLFLDTLLRIQRFTPTAAEVINLIDSDIGRPLGDFVVKLNYDRLVEDAKEVLDTLVSKEQEVRGTGGAWYSMRVMPYRTAENVIDGVVITFIDITQQKQVEVQLRRLTAAVEQCHMQIVITDGAGNIEYVNPRFTEVTGYTLTEVYGKNARLLKSGEQVPNFYQRLWKTISAGQSWHGRFHNRKKSGELYWERAWITPVTDATGKVTHYLSTKEVCDENQPQEEESYLRRVGRVLYGLQEWNQEAASSTAEGELLDHLCRVLVDDGGYCQVWIGSPRQNRTRTVQVVAAAGFPEGSRPKASWGETAAGKGPTGTAIRTGRPAWIRHMRTDPAYKHWWSEADRLGYRATCSVPLAVDGHPPFALTLHADEPDAFKPQEVALIQQLADHVVETLSNPNRPRHPTERGKR